MPSIMSRGSLGGRPIRLGAGNRSAINCHCSSVSRCRSMRHPFRMRRKNHHRPPSRDQLSFRTRPSWMNPDYAIIVAHGGSGSCWLLGLFDLDSASLCRNEPYSIPGSPLAQLTPDRLVSRPNQPLLANAWDNAATWTARRMGQRDRPLQLPTHHIYSLAWTLSLPRLLQRAAFRRVLGLIQPSLRTGEWPPPLVARQSSSLR